MSKSDEIEGIETLDISDDEDPSANQYESIPLNIDYNSRIVSKESNSGLSQSDACDVRFRDPSMTILEDKESGHTSTEEFTISDDEATLPLQSLHLDRIVGLASKLRDESFSNLSYTSRISPQSDEASGGAEGRIGSNITALHDVRNVFSDQTNHLFGESLPPLMTCLEFIKAENSDGGETDVEDISESGEKLYPQFSVNGSHEQINGWNRGLNINFLSPGGRRSSEVLTEDETVHLDIGSSNLVRRKTKRRNRYAALEKDDFSSGSLTDEEYINVPKLEWTENDESGGTRQVTQIKTETSIKLEGDENDSAADGDDLISRTTTTTTRIVTTVTTEGDGEAQVADSSDDLRHSVEVILNQFMSDDSKPEHDE